MISIFGYIAAFCTTISFIPQIIKIIKEKNTRDISIGMYIIFTFGIFMWLIYGIMLNELPIIIANFFTLVFSCIILFLNLKMDKLLFNYYFVPNYFQRK